MVNVSFQEDKKQEIECTTTYIQYMARAPGGDWSEFISSLIWGLIPRGGSSTQKKRDN
jgi:hypothetical protein